MTEEVYSTNMLIRNKLHEINIIRIIQHYTYDNFIVSGYVYSRRLIN
jgi:hypothetical protein